MSKNKLLVIIFTLLVVSYSCVKKSKALRPDVTYDLSMSIDYCGDKTPPSSESPIVKVSYTKNVVSAENESNLIPVVFSDEKLLEGVIQIPEKAEVTITIETDYNTYLNDISADASSEFDTTLKVYTFIMTNNKSFEVKLSKTAIEMTDFIFESGNNGVVEISVSENGAAKPKQIAKAGSNIRVSAVKENIDNYVISAEPKADNTYEFEKWSGSATGDNNPLTITSAMAGTIKASFKKSVVSADITFTFTAGENGSIYLLMLNDDGDVVSNIVVADNNNTGTLTLKESLFSTYTMQLAAYGSVGNTSYGIAQWGDGVASEKRPLKKAKTTYSATFSPKTITYEAGSPPDLVDGWYEIKNKDHLLYIAHNRGIWWNTKYKVMNDIDYGGSYHLPIGNPFNGVINGNNKRIKNARFGIVSSGFGTSTGLIQTGSTGLTISNLVIDSSVIINSSAQNVGSFGSYILAGKIYNSVNEANIIAINGNMIGGIAGRFYSGTIKNTYNTGAIYGSGSKIGGITGEPVSESIIQNVYTIGGGVQSYYKIGNDTGVNISGVFELPPDLHTKFNTALSTDVWVTKNGRPVLKGIGEGVGIN